MEDLVFNEKVYMFIEVKNTRVCFEKDVKASKPKEGDCIFNSYKVAEKIDNVKMVEGFLVSYFEDGTLECVGHVWNEINGSHFDVTKGIKKHDKIIKSDNYFIASVYDSKDKKTVKMPKAGGGMYDIFLGETEKHLAFKTEVKLIEKDLLSFLKNENN